VDFPLVYRAGYAGFSAYPPKILLSIYSCGSTYQDVTVCTLKVLGLEKELKFQIPLTKSVGPDLNTQPGIF